MAIEFNNTSLGPLSQSGGKTAQQSAAEDAAKAKAQIPARDARADDSVEISADANSLRAMQARLERQESFDEARVEEIKRAIADGQYPIDNQRLAEKFLQLESSL